MTATRARKRQLLESSWALTEGSVDRAAKVIAGVKVIGNDSLRGRTYTRECLQKAMPLYEGARVYVGHTKRAGQPRKPDEQPVGWLENVHLDDAGGLSGDLHYLESHPVCASLVEAAERNPSLWALSHNAHGVPRRTRRGEEITEILAVHSVDLVHKGATTKGLFEGEPMTLKLSEYLKALKLKGKHAKARKALLEYADPEMPMDEGVEAPAEDAPATDHTEALRAGFEASCMAVVQSGLSGDMDAAEALKKLGMMLKAHAKLAGDDGGGGKAGEEEPLEEEDEDDEEEEGKPVKESADPKKELARLKAKEACRDLCEAEGVTRPGKQLLEAMALLRTEDARKALLEEWQDGRQTSGRKPITQKAGGKGTTTGGQIADAKGFAAALRGGN